MIQQPPLFVGANGSSFLSMGPHTEGTKGSFVSLQNAIKLVDASEIVILGISSCSFKFLLYSNNRVSFASEIFCALLFGISFDLRKTGKSEKKKRREKKGRTK